MVRFLAAASILCVSSLAALAGESDVGIARNKSGKEVPIVADKKVLAYLKFEKFVLEDTDKKPMQLTITCIITRKAGEDDNFQYIAYDANDVVLAKKKLGTREETKTVLDEKTPVKLRVPAETVKVRFKTDL